MKNLFLLLVCVACFAACPKDDEVVDPYTQELALDIVTGLQARDSNGAPAGLYGNPNVFSGEVDVYPNPALAQANVQYFGGSGLDVQQYWIIAATQNTDYAGINYDMLLRNDTYSADEVSTLNTVQTNVVGAAAFAIDFSGFTPGYYRIFYLMSDETLLWDNLYIDPNAGSPMTLLNQVAGDW